MNTIIADNLRTEQTISTRIEVFFKMCKSYLSLSKEFQGRSYDMMTAHTTIVFMRYIMLALEARNSTDHRTVGDSSI